MARSSAEERWSSCTKPHQCDSYYNEHNVNVPVLHVSIWFVVAARNTWAFTATCRKQDKIKKTHTLTVVYYKREHLTGVSLKRAYAITRNAVSAFRSICTIYDPSIPSTCQTENENSSQFDRLLNRHASFQCATSVRDLCMHSLTPSFSTQTHINLRARFSSPPPL